MYETKAKLSRSIRNRIGREIEKITSSTIRNQLETIMNNGQSSYMKTRMCYVYGICVRDLVDAIFKLDQNYKNYQETLKYQTVSLLAYIQHIYQTNNDQDDEKEDEMTS